MRRPPATIVVLAWNEWQSTRACLDSLRPTLGPGDEVVVVDNGSTDQTPRGLKRYPWLRQLTNEDNSGFAAGCNQGAAVASNDIVVFLNNDTLPVGRWLDALLEPFADESIAATGPRSNFVSGPQLVPEVGYAVPKRSEIRRFEREWNQRHRSSVTDVDRLVGFCLAVRRDLFESIDGFDEGFGLGGFEDDDLCLRLLATGHRLVIAHGSFLHHDGHKTFDANGLDWQALQQQNGERFRAKHASGPAHDRADAAALLSACLIVRDEEAHLGSCLASIDGVVDEVVVYDTGSTDGTVALARSLGARVVEGHWDDDFSRARNAALAACTGEWILQIDADEELVVGGDLRTELRATQTEALAVEIHNRDDDGALMYAHAAIRIFRRDRGRWTGRLHEHVVGAGGAALSNVRSATVHLDHHGYGTAALAASDKLERNVQIGRKALEGAGAADGRSVLNLARALRSAGNRDEALTAFERALTLQLTAVERRLALGTTAVLLVEMHRPADALPRLQELEREGGHPSLIGYVEALALAELGELDAAVEKVLPLRVVRDGDGYEIPVHAVLVQQGELCARAGRWEDAAARLTEAASLDPTVVPWPLLAKACAEVGGAAPASAATFVTDSLVLDVVAQLERAGADAAHVLLDALWERFPGDQRLLAGAVRYGPSLRPEAALEWAARLRTVGLESDCPLAAIAGDPARDGRARVRAAALLAGAFDLEQARELLPGVASSVQDEAFADTLLELDSLAPTLLPEFVELLASTPRRCRALSEVLSDLGAAEEAAAIAELGRTLEEARLAAAGGTLDQGTGGPGRDGRGDVAPGVVVLGMHRSGTSAATRILNLLGLRTADGDDLMAPAAYNERGFWESTALSAFNDELLGMLGGTWSTPPLPVDGWEDAAEFRALRGLARRRLEETLGNDGKWVWKDPRSCLTFPFWASVLPAPPVLVLPYRNPLEVWRSLERRDGITKAHALAMWERYVRTALAQASGRPTLVASYDALVDDPQQWSEQAAAFLTAHGFDVDLDGARGQIADFVAADLRHARHSDADVAADPDLSSAQRDLWERLHRLAGAHDALDAGALPAETFWVEPLLGALRSPALDPGAGSVEPLTVPARPSANPNPTSTPRCSIIVPLFNKVDYTRRCIEALIEHTDDELYELVLIDNGCTDDTEALLQQLEGDVVIIRNEQNLGFACASNQGARAARGEHLLFLNNDTEAHAGWLPPLLDALDDPGVGAVGARLLYPDGKVQHAGVHVVEDRRRPQVPFAPVHRLHRAAAEDPEVMQAGAMSALTGACLLVRRDAFFAAGAFDEAYWNGYEDVELCFRLREAGWELRYEPASCLTHHESVSGPERFSAEDRNVQLLLSRWTGRVPADVVIDGSGHVDTIEDAAHQEIRTLATARTA